ncbi:hypothetical protein ASE27_10090 [Oerskovia sp. Root918]|uniref:M15 family metallopeptidase n=1 Tax=Oerskovia sp. Root918 TaxID=1736607 RepID=UPI0006F9D25A|nr:M15 family metallopeptidase [Oerskovia sp. Root918]KRD36796.1 hypothetical protein ASE27_10090 [Oerskovia sp. Root918]
MADNGRLPPSELAALFYASNHRLRPDAARSWNRVNAAFRCRTGINIDLSDSYRSYDDQVAIFLDRYQTTYIEYAPGRTDRRVWNGTAYWRKPGTSAAAIPGTSNHGWGLAVDADGLGGFAGYYYAILTAVAPRHGWNNEAGKTIDEPWHWEYFPSADTHPERNDMAHLIKGNLSPAIYVLEPSTGLRRYITSTEYTVYTDQGSSFTTMPQAEFDAIPKAPGSR